MIQTFEPAIYEFDGFTFHQQPKSKLTLRDESLVFRFDGYGYPVEFDGMEEHLVDLSWTWEAKRQCINSWSSAYMPDIDEYTVKIHCLDSFLEVGFKLKSEQLVFIKSLREWVFSKPAPKRKKKPDAN